MSKNLNILSWIYRIIVAVILLQTLFFKFIGATESKYIFTTLMSENEALGRISSGVVELFSALLLLIPKTTWLGALIAFGTITEAIFSHLIKLEIVIQDDGGTLFILACIVFVLSALILWLHRKKTLFLGSALR